MKMADSRKEMLLMVCNLRVRYSNTTRTLDTNHEESYRSRVASFRARQSREQLQLVIVLVAILSASLHVDRAIWMKPRSPHFWEFVVNRNIQ